MCELPVEQSGREMLQGSWTHELKLESQVGAGCGGVVVVKTRREDNTETI